MSEQSAPCVPGLFGEEGGAHVLGSRCTTCKTPYFPKADVCRNPDCEQSVMVEERFGGLGTVWSYSTADFAPPPPHKFDPPFKPYAVGVVDMDNGMRLVGQMVDAPDTVKVGDRVELVIAPLYHEGDAVRTSWKFKRV